MSTLLKEKSGMNIKKILFVTLVKIDDIEESGIYTDLIGEFLDNGYHATIICPLERRFKSKSKIIKKNNLKIIQVKSLNIQKTNFIEKTISTFLIEFLFIRAFNNYCKKDFYDISLFTTPPVFITNFIRKLNSKKTKIKYLLLKDIFPQNALDLKLINNKNPLYLYSKFVEKKLYKEVDFIGCMSKKNLDYIYSNYKISLEKLEINPNSINPEKYPVFENMKNNSKLNIIYGGNLGLPQNPELIKIFIQKIEKLNNVSFTIVGSGTAFKNINEHINSLNITKTKLISNLRKKEYFALLEKSDIGLIFLNEKFTIPNYPSRILDYLHFNLSIFTNTDKITDLTEFIEQKKIGKCFYGKDEIDLMIDEIEEISNNNEILITFKSNTKDILIKDFNVKTSFNLIDSKLNSFLE